MGDFDEGAGTSKRKRKKNTKCSFRLDELAKPKKWRLLTTWTEYANNFNASRVENIRQKVQEDFCMTPEETEKYIDSLRKVVNRKRHDKEKRKEDRKEKKAAQDDAYCLVRKFLKKSMMYACQTVLPPLVSPMLRYMSETILTLLAELHCVEIPKRCDKSSLGQFLLAISDWAAIYLAHVYYEVDADEKMEIEKFKEMERIAAELEAGESESEKEIVEEEETLDEEEEEVPA